MIRQSKVHGRRESRVALLLFVRALSSIFSFFSASSISGLPGFPRMLWDL